MSSAEKLKRFIGDRLAAAADEIFGVFEKTIVEYEEEIDRQRKLFNIAWRPVVKLRRVELQQQGVCKEEEEEVLADQQLWNQECNSSQRQEEPEPSQTEEEQEELCSRQLRLKQEPGDFKLTSPNEENGQSEDQTLDWNPEEFSGESQVKSEVITSVVSEAYGELLPPSDNCQVAERQDQTEGKHEVSQLMRDARKELKGRQCKSYTNTDSKPTTSDSHSGEESFTCDKCGKDFNCGSELREHIPTHMGISQHVCQTCGLQFLSKSALSNHKKSHKVKKSHVCQICNKVFKSNYKLMRHAFVHTGERPYRCKICGKGFRDKYSLVPHMRLHTGEKPYRCQTCGKTFTTKCSLVNHTASHTDKRSYVCQTCGRAFKHRSTWMAHIKVHTGDRPNLCQTAGKAFPKKSGPVKHVGSRAVENQLFCKTCKKVFVSRSFLLLHIRQFHRDD